MADVQIASRTQQTDQNDRAFRKPSMPASATRSRVPDIRTDMLDRRRSVQRDPLLGPRPLDTSAKRFFSAGPMSSHHSLRPTTLAQSASLSVLERPRGHASISAPHSDYLSLSFGDFPTLTLSPSTGHGSSPTTAASSLQPHAALSFHPPDKSNRARRHIPVLKTSLTPDLVNTPIPDTRAIRRQTLAAPMHAWSQARSPVSAVSDKSGTPRSALNATSTPLSAKRQSGRASGLGARTISPTDARRLRRLSAAPSSQPLPSPQKSLAPDARPALRSPSMLTLKTNLTPRESPDSTSSYFPATTSLSSSSSYSSLPPHTHRPVQSPSLSKLPTLKRNTYSSTSRDEDFVPPVPAIPKAFESPREQSQPSYFHSTIDADARKSETQMDFRSHDETPQRRVMTAGATTSTRTTQEPTTPVMKKRTTMPLRLPPLNVLPLSTPTAARINAFPIPSEELDGRQKTPTVRNYSRTPTTPMTASKAQFKSTHEELFVRASTSQHNSRHSKTQSQSARPSTPHSSVHTPSSALPSTVDDEYTLSTQHVTTLPSEAYGARSSAASQTVRDGNEPPTPASGTPLRRKFSLTWKGKRDVVAPEGQSEDAPEMPAIAASYNNHLNVPDSVLVKPTGARSTSWSFRSNKNVASQAKQVLPKLRARTKSFSERLEIDDMTAHDEMRRLAAKRREVDEAAKATDRLITLATPKDQLTPSQAIQSSSWQLNIYEKGEIIDYREGVSYCGSRSARKHVGDISSAGTANFGYDDERGDYNIVIGDHLAYRYEVVDLLGKGSFGQVIRCIDHRDGGLCAIKIIRNKKRFHQQALVEVNILNKLKEWDPDDNHATLTITSSFYFRSHLCIVTPCLSVNLYELVRAHSFQGFSLQLIRCFARQILTCLELLQDKQVIHCDLKPENILLCDPRRAEIKVIDFGSSCRADEKVYTYIQSRFYRSPEVILGSEYGLGIDMWSFGCILAELYTGYPLFPGENEQEQLACVMEIFGPPPRDMVEKCTRRKLFFDSNLKPRVFISSKGKRRKPSSKSLSSMLKCDDEAFLDFITQCLRWDTRKRIGPDAAITHPFVTNERLRKQSREARIGARVGSPIKRAPSNAIGQTPIRTGRPLPETPSTVVRSAVTREPADSPNKSRASRRQSVASSASTSNNRASQAMATATNKRTVQGLQGATAAMQSSSSLPRVNSGRVDLASAAARESMGAGAAGTRWR